MVVAVVVLVVVGSVVVWVSVVVLSNELLFCSQVVRSCCRCSADHRGRRVMGKRVRVIGEKRIVNRQAVDLYHQGVHTAVPYHFSVHAIAPRPSCFWQ